MKAQGVSIIICCHNGAERLPETIRHIARQRVPAHIPWELLIIDNGSTDDTALVARKEWQKHRVDTYIRIVRESTLGLSYARARGFREAMMITGWRRSTSQLFTRSFRKIPISAQWVALVNSSMK